MGTYGTFICNACGKEEDLNYPVPVEYADALICNACAVVAQAEYEAQNIYEMTHNMTDEIVEFWPEMSDAQIQHEAEAQAEAEFAENSWPVWMTLLVTADGLERVSQIYLTEYDAYGIAEESNCDLGKDFDTYWGHYIYRQMPSQNVETAEEYSARMYAEVMGDFQP